MKFNLFNLNFDNYNLIETLEKIEEHIINKQKPIMIFTPNAELIVRSNKDEKLRAIYNNAGILTIDSWVVYYSARLFRKKVTEPVSAANIMFKSLDMINSKGYKIYLLGAKQEVLDKVCENLKKDYPNINIVGSHNGYFDKNEPGDIVQDIKNTKPDILFVAMSTPLKENFVAPNLEEMNVPVSIGVGGSFDIIAGMCQHAPVWISKAGLEWFYRFIQEPRRMWKRYLITNTLYIKLIIREIFKKRSI